MFSSSEFTAAATATATTTSSLTNEPKSVKIWRAGGKEGGCNVGGVYDEVNGIHGLSVVPKSGRA